MTVTNGILRPPEMEVPKEKQVVSFRCYLKKAPIGLVTILDPLIPLTIPCRWLGIVGWVAVAS